jgi:hypothetical protein
VRCFTLFDLVFLSVSSPVFRVRFLTNQGTYLSTLATGWFEYFRLGYFFSP